MNDIWDEVAEAYVGAEEIDSLWNLAEDLSITDAAALVAGYNPSMIERYKEVNGFDRAFPRYAITLKAICNAITNGRMKASLRYSAREYGYAEVMTDIEYAEALGTGFRYGRSAGEDEILSKDHSFFYKTFPVWSLSTVCRDDLVTWLESRGIRTGFFFAKTDSDAPDYLDPANPRYAPKLAATVRAWQAVKDPGRKSAKQALEKWLREHAAEFGLVDDDGNPVAQAVEDCSKVANWNPSGGAPKTPGG